MNFRSILKYLATGITLIIPTLVGLGILFFIFQTNLSEFRIPGIGGWNDQTLYWLQSRTFAEVGMAGGYYTVNEAPPAWDLFRFYAWGPAIPVLYGTLARVTGWHYATPIVFHSICLSLATAYFVFVAKPNRWQLLFLAILLVCYPPIIYYWPTAMSEGIQFSIAITLATAFYQLQHSQKPKRIIILLGVMIYIASWFRMTWLIFIIFLCVYPTLSNLKIWQTIAAFILGCILFVGLLFIQLNINAIYPTPFSEALSYLPEDLGAFLNFIQQNIVSNIESISRSRRLFQILDLQILFLSLFMLYKILRAWWLERQAVFKNAQMIEYLLHVFNLVSITVITATLYQIYSDKDYRVFAAHFLLSMILLIAYKHYRLVLFFLLGFVFSLLYLKTPYQDMVKMHYTDYAMPIQDVNQLKEVYEEHHVQYQSETDNPWCNTILISIPFIRNIETFVALDAGFGISIIVNADSLDTHFKSQYLLLIPNHFETLQSKGVQLEYLADVDIGALYRNPESDC